MKPRVSLREALADDKLLGRAIPDDSWLNWRTFLIASMGEPLITNEERDAFALMTYRVPNNIRPEEIVVIAGRRAGKTRAVAVLASYVSCLCDHNDVLAVAERGTFPILSASTAQAAKAFQHVAGILNNSPVLSQAVQSQTADTIKLSTGVDIEVRPANFRTIRGVTAVGAAADEVAFWHNNESSTNPDHEILNALRPALATTRGPLIIISSPYAKRGELYRYYREHFGNENDPSILVARAASRFFNSTLPQSVVDRALKADADVARAEYLAEFREDIESYLPRAVIDACVSKGVHERLPDGRSYSAFADMSGGRSDSSVLAVGYRDGRRPVLACIREINSPHNPQAAAAEFSEILRNYRVRSVTADKYAGEWVVDAFRQHGITCEQAAAPRTDLYLNLLPLITSGECVLLDNQTLVSQLANLERRNGSGRPVIDHAPGQHDDVANAAAGCLTALRQVRGYGLAELRAALA